MLTQSRLKEIITYDPKSGKFYWISANGPRAYVGEEAGCIHHSGYRYIQIDNMSYGAHRLAILYTEGYLPENSVDHINRVRTDNRRENLREASRQCQTRNSGMLRNNSSGVKGIFYHKQNRKWVAHISIAKVGKYLGIFDDLAEAAYHRYAAEQCLGFPDCDINSSAKQFIERSLVSRTGTDR